MSITYKCIPTHFDQRSNEALYDINISYGSLLVIWAKTSSISPVILVNRDPATGGRVSRFLIRTFDETGTAKALVSVIDGGSFAAFRLAMKGRH